MNPSDLKYRTSHEWVAVADDVATIGISAFAIEQLSDVTFLQLPEVGTSLSEGDELGEIESVKAVASVYSPVTGEVLEVNAGLPDELEKLNEDPFGEGWVAKIKITDASTLDNLLDHEAYQKQCAEEG